MDGPEGWERMTKGVQCLGFWDQKRFCPGGAVAEAEWRGRYLEMRSKDREPSVWDASTAEATSDGGGSYVERRW